MLIFNTMKFTQFFILFIYFFFFLKRWFHSFNWKSRRKKNSLWWRQSVCNFAGPGRATASATSSCVGRRPRYRPGLFPASSSTTIRLSTWLDDPSFTHPHSISMPSAIKRIWFFFFFFFRFLIFLNLFIFLCILVMCVYSVGDGPGHITPTTDGIIRDMCRPIACAVLPGWWIALAIKKPLLTLVALWKKNK